MSGVSAAQARSLLALMDVALDQPDPSTFLEQHARVLSSKSLRRCALDAARSLAAGEPPSRALPCLPIAARAALEVGERIGAPSIGVERALASLELTARTRGMLLTPLMQPLMGLSVAVLAASLAASIGAPAIFDLQREMSGGFGGAEPGAWLGFLAQHPRGVLVGGALAAFALAMALPFVAMLSRTLAGSALLLRLPLAGSLLRNVATTQHSAALGALLAARTSADVAHAGAAASVSIPALRRSLERATPRVAAGDAMDDVLRDAGLPRLAASLRMRASDDDGGVAACIAAHVAAEEACADGARRLGQACAVVAISVTSILALALLSALLLPLLSTGGA